MFTFSTLSLREKMYIIKNRMGIISSRSVALNQNENIVQKYLENPDTMDFPQAAGAFEHIGSYEYAVLCWLAAGRPTIAERVYERGGVALVDDRFGYTPIWRMICAIREGRIDIIDETKRRYLEERSAPWIARIVAAI